MCAILLSSEFSTCYFVQIEETLGYALIKKISVFVAFFTKKNACFAVYKYLFISMFLVPKLLVLDYEI